MARIAATLVQAFTVPAPLPEVYALFANPARLRELMPSVEGLEQLEDGTVRWVLVEKIDKGIRFKGDYVVRYEGNGADMVRWTSVGGNLGSSGEVRLSPDDAGGTRVWYEETVEPDLPVTSILAKLLRPIVARELKAEVAGYLERIKEHFAGPARAAS